MKSLKMLLVAAISCMAVVFFSGSAQADLDDIIGNYCEDVLANVSQTAVALVNASVDLTECDVELDQCLRDEGRFSDPSRCIRDYTRCTRVGKGDQRLSSDSRRSCA
jgi:hypothetical protein